MTADRAEARIQALTIAQALASLKTTAGGLAAAEVARRRSTFGPNLLEEIGRESLAVRFGREFVHLFAIILWVAAALALAAEHYAPGQGMATLGAAIVGVIFVNAVFSFWQEYKAERAVAALRDLLPQKVTVVRGADAARVPAAELVPGDVLIVEEGDRVPADCRVIEAFGLRVNTATVTGESRAQSRTSDPSAEDSAVQARNLLLAGTAVVSGQGRAVVFATGMRTEFGRIARITQTAGEAVSPLQREIARLSRLVAVLSIGIGLAFFPLGTLAGLSFWESALFAIGIIVANVPEGLLPIVTLSLAMATQRMARRNVLVRHLPAVEALGATTVICCDKTGTLTRNSMAVRRLWLGGAECTPDDLGGDPDRGRRHRELFVNAAVCHNLAAVRTRGARAWQGDPMEVALAEMGRQEAGALDAIARVDEIPFDTDRMRMSVLCATPRGRVLYCKGALATVLDACASLQLDAGTVPLDPAGRARLLAAEDAMTATGLRVLAFAHRALADGDAAEEREMVLAGLVGLEDPPRPEVREAVARCDAAGIRVIMITGDHPRTALAVARQTGLVGGGDPAIVTGDELRRMSDAELRLALDADGILFARVAAEQKMQIVEALQAKGEVVAVTGDGVNDAPALKTADIGIAMGSSGTDVAREASDLVLLDDNLSSIVAAVEEGRGVYDNLRKFLTYVLTSNVPELVPYLAFALFRIPLPLTVIQVLAVDLGTDLVPALALGAEKPDPDVMRRPPRRRSEPLLTPGLLVRAYLFLGVLEAAAAMAAFFFVLGSGGWRYGESLPASEPLYLRATTACLAAIVAMQIVNLFLCRHPRKSSLAFKIAGNVLIPVGIAAELALLAFIAYTPVGNSLFGAAPIGLDVLLVAIPFAALMWLLDEARKAWLRRRARDGRSRDA